MSWSYTPRWNFPDSLRKAACARGDLRWLHPRRPYACTLDLITRLRARYDPDTPRLSEADDNF